MEILSEGGLADEQRQRLLEIADERPVHRTLTSEIRIESRLSDLELEFCRKHDLKMITVADLARYRMELDSCELSAYMDW